MISFFFRVALIFLEVDSKRLYAQCQSGNYQFTIKIREFHSMRSKIKYIGILGLLITNMTFADELHLRDIVGPYDPSTYENKWNINEERNKVLREYYRLRELTTDFEDHKEIILLVGFAKEAVEEVDSIESAKVAKLIVHYVTRSVESFFLPAHPHKQEMGAWARHILEGTPYPEK
jgi:hypothetical protein